MKKHSEENSCRGSDGNTCNDASCCWNERVKAAVGLDDMLVNLEVEFRRDLDPKKILTKVMRLTCEFYGGDWCGALDIKADVDTWTPVWWFNARTQAMTETRFYEYETVGQYPQWANALKEEKTITIHNMDEVKEKCPEELMHYERLSTSSVIAAPYYKGSTGFLVVRNPTKYLDNLDCLKLMAYVVSCELNDYRLIENCRHQMVSDLIQDNKDVVINMFGGLEIYTVHGVMKAQDIEKQQIAKVVEYLALHPERAHSAREMGSVFYDDLQDVDGFVSNLKHYIYRFRSGFGDLFPEEGLIISTNAGYRLNEQLHVRTDLQLFDEEFARRKNISNPHDRTRVLEGIVALYKGPVFQPEDADAWILPIVYKYHDQYITAICELFRLLDEQKDYSLMHDYAARALLHEKSSERIYYWMIVSAEETHKRDIAKREYATARNNMDSDSFRTLTKKLTERYPEKAQDYD